MEKGKLIVIEGVDGAGKTVMCRNICNYMNDELNKKTTVITLPYNDCSNIYTSIRKMLKDKNTNQDLLQALMLINMKDCINGVVKHSIENGANVILDRWLVSTIVYNTAFHGTIYESMINHLTKLGYSNDIKTRDKLFLDIVNKEYCGIDIYPDLVLYLFPPEGVVLKHSQERSKGNDTDINDRIDVVKNTYETYKKFYSSYKTLYPFIEREYDRGLDESIVIDELDKTKDIHRKIEVDKNEADLPELEIYNILTEKVKNEVNKLLGS